MKSYVGIIRDHSGSMNGLTNQAIRDYNDNIQSLKDASVGKVIDTRITVGICDSYQRDKFQEVHMPLSSVLPIRTYETGYSTPLFDSVGAMINKFQDTEEYRLNRVASFLIMVITDGQENASKNWTSASLSSRMKELQATDKWTFAFRVPRGYKFSLVKLGIPEGNILEWEQTEEGFKKATFATRDAIEVRYSGLAKGVTKSDTFFTDMSNVKSKTVETKLQNISNDVKFFPVTSKYAGAQIRDFCNSVLKRPMIKGAAFYQLTKTEKKVQDYKIIAIRDKKKDEVYTGAHARQLLGLPYHGEVKIVPGNHGQYDIFIQSTSVNRKLVAGTEVLYWEQNMI